MASSEMISSEFADQARDCWTDFRSWKALAGCEHVFATSVANMMGLLIVRPTQVWCCAQCQDLGNTAAQSSQAGRAQ